MSKHLKSLLIALVVGTVVGAALPLIELAFDCRDPHSEACVWGHSLLPVSVTISTVVIGGLVAAAVFVFLEWRRSGK